MECKLAHARPRRPDVSQHRMLVSVHDETRRHDGWK